MIDQQQGNYDEWVKKINAAAGIANAPQHTQNKEKQNSASFPNHTNKNTKKIFLISLFIFLLAFLPRIFFIFFVSDTQNAGVGWYNDSYHHWQIAYLTKEIGLHKEFLRLWDLQGLDLTRDSSSATLLQFARRSPSAQSWQRRAPRLWPRSSDG